MNKWQNAQELLLFFKFDPYPLLGFTIWMFVPSYELAVLIGLLLIGSMFLQRMGITVPIALRMIRFNMTLNSRSSLPFERRKRIIDNDHICS